MNKDKLAIIGLGYVGLPLADALGWRHNVGLQQGIETMYAWYKGLIR